MFKPVEGGVNSKSLTIGTLMQLAHSPGYSYASGLQEGTSGIVERANGMKQK